MKKNYKKYVKKGLIIGGIIGFFVVIIQSITMQVGTNIIYRMNFVPVYFTDLIINLFSLTGEAYPIYALILFLLFNMIFYLAVGYTLAIIYGVIKHEKRK